MDDNSAYAVVVLAAGASRRMGQPKQLLAINGSPLLRRVVQAAVDAKIGRVIVVLGDKAGQIRPALASLPVDVVVNEAWEEGMGSSLRSGMMAIDGDSGALRGVIVVLGDQPEISAAHLIQLSRTQVASAKSIVASRGAGKLSPPVLFAPVHFPALRASRGDAGARVLLRANPDQIAIVDTDDLVDLDTPEDYDAFIKRRD